MGDLEKRKPSVSQAPHPLPGQSCALAAAPKRHEPVPHGLRAKGIQRPLITRHAVVVGVAPEDAGEPAPLIRDGPIAASPQLAPEGVKLCPRPLRVGDPLELKTPGPGLPADMREAQKPKRLRLAQTPFLTLLGGEPPAPHQSRLLGVQPQAELREPVAKIRPEPLGVVPILEPHHEVVSETHDHNITVRVPAETPLDFDQTVWFRPRPDKIRYFDPQTKDAIWLN